MEKIPPRIVGAVALRVVCVAVPAAAAVAGLWVGGVWLGDQPVLTLMLFGLCLAFAAGGACVWALAACHLQTHRAFAAGLETGLYQTDRRLRVVRQVDV